MLIKGGGPADLLESKRGGFKGTPLNRNPQKVRISGSKYKFGTVYLIYVADNKHKVVTCTR